MRFFLIDRVTEIVPGERARALKCVTLTDEVLHDHFPDHPVLPGTLVVEALAQLSGLLLEMTLNEPGELHPRRALLAQIDRAKFRRPALAGDRIELSVSIASSMEAAARMTGEAAVDGESIARAELTFVMKAVESERLAAQRRAVYELWTRGLTLPRPLP